MSPLKPNYVTDSKANKVAVQLDIATFNKIEDVLENYGLYKLMEEQPDEPLVVEDAKAFYQQLKKKKYCWS